MSKTGSKKTPTSDLNGLKALIARAGSLQDGAKERALPPVDKWQPDHSGELDMEIRSDGTWYYEGSQIRRQALINLFATIVRKDADGHTYLVTSVEKMRIRVVDAPFIAVEMHAQGSGEDAVLTFRTNTGDILQAGAEHPLRFEIDTKTGGVKPYLLVRGRLEALLARAVMHELMELGEILTVDGAEMFALRSNGVVFPVMAASDLEASLGGDPAALEVMRNWA